MAPQQTSSKERGSLCAALMGPCGRLRETNAVFRLLIIRYRIFLQSYGPKRWYTALPTTEPREGRS